MEFAILAVRFLLASVFMLAGLAKIPHRREFTRLVRRYGVLPPGLVAPVAALLPPLELVCGLCLAVGFSTAPIAAVLGVILGAFTVVVAANLLRGNEIDCGCFNISGPSRISWFLVGRNLVLGAMAASIVVQPPGALSLDALLFDANEHGITRSDAIGVLVATVATTAVIAMAAESANAWKALRASGTPAA